MIKAIHFPLEMVGHELDEYLAKGWFRMGQTIFTTDFIPVEGKIHPVFWLRFDIRKVKFGKKQKRLLATNKEFTVAIQHFRLTDELEALYSIYQANIDFETSPSVESNLLDGDIANIYDTQLITVRDKGRLIAAGIFDNGFNSMAGILNFYHPEYKSKSPGKYLMLLKINYAIETGKHYYYPGYIAGGFSKFDYKLFPDVNAAELYDSVREQWVPFPGSSLPVTISFNNDIENAG
ncbi:MAG: hypothetical protein JNN00_02955 [Chitinophagaceae bacterium]|nr:hypothetical protein [Chitinophagaceae bacterium]